MNEDEEIIWLAEDSPHDPLAVAIYSELHFERYSEYFELGSKLQRQKYLQLTSNGVQISFGLNGKFLKIEYSLPDDQVIGDRAKINLKPLVLQNSVEQQLLLKIAEAETNALLFKPGVEFKLYNQPAIGFFVDVESIPKLRYKIDNLKMSFRSKIGRFN